MNVSLRPATAADDDFLFGLYVSTRDDVAAFGWGAAQIDVFLRMQFNAQRASYAAAFSNAEHSILSVDGALAGRLMIARIAVPSVSPPRTDEGPVHQAICLVDISLLPQFRSKGTGTQVIRDLMRRCHDESVPLVLHVATSNIRARALYERLGLVRIGGDAMYDEMRWDIVG